MRYPVSFLALLCLLLCVPLSALANAGSINALEGTVQLTSKKPARTMKKGDTVAVGDKLLVAPNSWAILRMNDGGSYTLRAGSEFQVNAFRFNKKPQPTDSSVVTLFKGSMRAISGMIGKVNKDSYQIKTPTATIGIRGTDHDVMVVPDPKTVADTPAPAEGSTEEEDEASQEPALEPGTYNTVNDGETVLNTAQGSVSLKKGQAGYVPLFGKRLPQLLDKMPALLDKLGDEDLKAGIQEHLKSIHEMLNDGTFRSSMETLQQLRDLRQKPHSPAERQQKIQQLLQQMQQ
jgi:hypothetical protein